MTGQERLLAKLREVLDQPDTIILVGSGVSLWSGLPSWTALLNTLADTLEEKGLTAAPVRQEISAGNLLLAASYAVHQLNKRELGTFLRKALCHPDAAPSDLHRAVAALGPSCFVTTNYDQLLETAIRQSGLRAQPRVVTNRQPVEIADIISASARDFVFKYHGDVADTESIVLSREQYRAIKIDYPGTLRALSTLLATRPVLLIGFGLQDPDFLLIQDELVSIFNGQAGEYFAIQPDFDALRRNYWRANYRTEAISYETLRRPDGSRDHGQLLVLLQELVSDKHRALRRHGTPITANHLLLLARLAASVAREKPISASDTLPLSVEFESRPKFAYRRHPGQLTALLRSYNASFLLLGYPGAGKSYALRQYAAELAEGLTERCLSGVDDVSDLHVPMFIDLTLYRGHLEELLQAALPTGLELAALLSTHWCTLIFDATNEMPRQFIESEHWVREFTNLQARFPETRFLIGCRNEAWIKTIELPSFLIQGIWPNFVEEQLLETVPAEALGNPALTLALSTPLLFTLVRSGSISIPERLTPSELYGAYWAKLNERWKGATGEVVDFAAVLEPVAYHMLENGIEYAQKVEFEQALSANVQEVDIALAALLRDGALIALSGQRVCFLHQSVTEHLAARVVARQYEDNQAILKALLVDKRWDQTLFMAVSHLKPENARDFIGQILAVDVVAGARAALYITQEQSDVIETILRVALTQSEDDFEDLFGLAWILKDLPYGDRNIPDLQLLADRNNMLGGVAAGLLFRVSSIAHEKIIISAFAHNNDFNYIQDYIKVSDKDWAEKDIYFLFEQLARPENEITDALGFYGVMLAKLPPDDLPNFCTRFLGTSSACRSVIADGLRTLDDAFATSVLMMFARIGDMRAFYNLYSHLKFHRTKVQRAELPLEDELVHSILKAVSTEDARWAVEAGQQLVAHNNDWAGAFHRKAREGGTDWPLMADIIETEIKDRGRPLQAALARCSVLNEHQIAAIGADDFWDIAPANALVEALETRLFTIADNLHLVLRNWDEQLPVFRKNDLHWWLDWIEECCDGECGAMGGPAYTLRECILKGSREAREQVIGRFNEGLSEDFWRIGCCVLCGNSGEVSTDEFSAAAIQLLLEEADKRPWIGMLLGQAATEQFVTLKLLPLMREEEPKQWVLGAIEDSGRRHNRRYIV